MADGDDAAIQSEWERMKKGTPLNVRPLPNEEEKAKIKTLRAK